MQIINICLRLDDKKCIKDLNWRKIKMFKNEVKA